MNKLTALKTIFFLCLLLGCSVALHAQLIAVKGIVRDSANKAPLSGVVVRSQTGTAKAISKEDGSFSLQAKKGDFISFSYVGYNNRRTKVENANLIIDLVAAFAEQQNVVVVAMDMKRKSRELGYSVQTVAGGTLQQTQRENFVNGLQGRVAGVTINPTSGQAGASSQIVLRGFNSASLSNQPLFIVDGIIMDNTSFSEASNSGAGIGLADDRPNRTNDYTNRISDLNPDDIASITVLKGPEATALYGSQASSGAIVITTKKPMGGHLRLSYDNSFRINKITRFPEMNNDYAPGFQGIPNTSYATAFTYFGPALATTDKTYDNIHNFFKNGFATSQNMSADFGTHDVGFRISGGFFDNTGVVPNNVYRKYDLKISNVTQLGKHLSISPTLSYINTYNKKPMRGSDGYLESLYSWPTTDNAKNYQDTAGNERLLYGASSPNAELLDNPFFSAYRNYSADWNSRWMATLGIDYHPFDWMDFAGRFGYDTYNQHGFILTDPQSMMLTNAAKGQLSNYYNKYHGYNHTITASLHKQYGKFTPRLMMGTMWQDYETRAWAVYGDKLIDNANTHGHSTDSSNIGAVEGRLAQNYFGKPNKSITKQIAYFWEASVGYNNVLFLTYSHRFESASVFPASNRNYNYPGFSLSAIMSDIIPALKGKVLNYWKLRASRATTARLMSPYMNQSVFVNNYASSASGVAYSYGYYNNNPNLKPETQRTFEIGSEFHLLNDRVNLELAYYNTHCLNQISVGYRASYGTGFILNTQNATESRNQGIEASLDINAIKAKDLDWNIHFNFNHMWSNVIAIPKSIDGYSDYYMSDTWVYANTRSGFVRNHPTTILTGYSYQRNSKGQMLIDPTTGLALVNTSFSPIADRNPLFSLGTTNNIRYKNWNLSFLWDLRIGGDVWDATDMYLTYIGRSERTKDRLTPRVLKGVLNDGYQNTTTPTVNTISVTPYYISNSYYSETQNMPDEEFVQHHVNALRLKDITLSYQFSPELTNQIKGLKSLKLFVTANDLLMFTNYHGADPNVSATSAGENGVGGYGMDFMGISAPVSFNFGLIANF